MTLQDEKNPIKSNDPKKKYIEVKEKLVNFFNIRPTGLVYVQKSLKYVVLPKKEGAKKGGVVDGLWLMVYGFTF